MADPRRVLDQHGQFTFPFYECLITVELPKVASDSHVYRTGMCRECERGGYSDFLGDEPTRLVYADRWRNAFHDFNLTWEQFGGTIRREPLRLSYVPRPLIIVSDRARAVITQSQKRGIRFEEIEFAIR